MSNLIFQIKNLNYHNLDGDLKDINIDLKFKEVHVLVIKNASEQEIFIESLRTFTKDSQGEIIFKGKNIGKERTIKNKISILRKKPILIDQFSIVENISLKNFIEGGFLKLIKKGKLKHKVSGILKMLDFDFNPNEKIKNLTREEKKLVYIAKIFSENPDVIIMHEPTEVLSPSSVSKLNRIIRLYKENGGSVIYITRQWEEALQIADQISVLSKGKIKGTLSAETAKGNPQRLLNMIGNYKYSGDGLDKEGEIPKILDAIFKSAEFLTSEYELKDVLLLLSKEVTKVMNAGGCVVHLIDEETDEIIDTLEFKENLKIESRMKKEAILKIAEKSDIYYSNSNTKGFNSLFEYNNFTNTIICVPVSIKSRITGIIQIFYEDLYVYSEEESKYLSTFARHAAIAIEDTRLMGRSALLQESHHRIKNNLQSIISLIALQKGFMEPDCREQVSGILDTITYRIKSIAKVHDILAKDKTGRSIVNVKKIIKEIIFHTDTNPGITIDLDVENIFIPYNKATSIALLINELVMNCLKHAFPNQESGTIKIQCNRIDNYIVLRVSDNGVGLEEDFDIGKLESLGLSIVNTIVTKEFQGKIALYNDGGTVVDIKLPDTKVF